MQEIDGNGGFTLGSQSRGGDPPIAIYNNAQLSSKAQSEGWTGSGTESDPYIIEDYDINGTDNHTCILIEDTDLHLVIRNNTLHDVSQRINIPYQGCAIRLDNVTNVTVIGNIIKDIKIPSGGIHVKDSRDVIIRENNISSVSDTIDIQSSTIDLIQNSVRTEYKALDIYQSPDCVVEGNRFYNDDDSGSRNVDGLRFDGSDHNFKPNLSIEISNNSFEGFDYTVHVKNGQVKFYNNNITGRVGITVQRCYNSSITDNTFNVTSLGGMRLWVNDNVTILRNTMYGGGIPIEDNGFWATLGNLTMDGSNTINGVPILVMDGVNDTRVGGGYSEYILNDCHNVTFQDMTMTTYFAGIWAGHSSNIVVSNIIANSSISTKMRFVESSDIIVANCTLDNVTIDINSYSYYDVTGIEIRDNVMFRCYIWTIHTVGVKVLDNHIVNGARGIFSHSGSGGLYARNNITLWDENPTYGAFYFSQSPGAIIRDNALWGAGFDVYFNRQGWGDHVFENNTIGGKPVLFIGEATDVVVKGGEWGQVLIGYCTNITLDGLTLEGTGEGVEVSLSFGVTINGTRVTDSWEAGISLQYCHDITVSESFIKDCGIGINSRDDDGLSIVDNWVLNSTKDGILVELGEDVSIERNVVMYSGMTGISAGADTMSSGKVASNYVSDNRYYGVLTTINIDVYGNTFIDNHRDPDTGEVESPQCMDERSNEWDDGSRGNFWSDYQTRYPDATNDGTVWDTPYEIKSNVLDNFPLVHPWDPIHPVANAGEDVEVVEGESFELNGSASHDNIGIVSYEWVLDDDSSGHHVHQGMTLTHHIDVVSVWTATLYVEDRQGNIAWDSKTINVLLNPPPVSDAGEDIEVDEGTTVTLDGSGSTDAHGIVGWQWALFYGGDDVVLKGEIVEFTFDLVGEYSVTLNVTDGLGKWAEDTLTVRVLDRTSPDIIVHRPVEDELTRNATSTVTGMTEPFTRVDINVESSEGSEEYTLTSSEDGSFEMSIDLFEGIQNVVVTATDAMGNPSVVTRNVILDTIPPDFIINSPDEEYVLTRQSRYTIVGTMLLDPAATVWIQLFVVAHTGVFQFEVELEEGVNLIEVKAVDEAGNEKVVVLTIVRDSIAPVLTVTSPPEDYLITNDYMVHFGGTVRDAIGVVIQLHSLDLAAELVTGSWQDGEWEYDLMNIPMDPEYDLAIIAYDLAGNEAMMVIYVRFDFEKPQLSIDGEALSYTNQSAVTISGTTEEGIETVMVNGVEEMVEDGDISVAVDLEEGMNTFVISVEDEAGNPSTEIIEITLDTVPPTYKLDYPKKTDKKKATISGTCSNDVVTMLINGRSNNVENGTYKVEVEIKEEGKNQFIITFEDRAGNTVTETITIRKGEETPGFGAWFAVLALAGGMIVLSRRRFGN